MSRIEVRPVLDVRGLVKRRFQLEAEHNSLRDYATLTAARNEVYSAARLMFAV